MNLDPEHGTPGTPVISIGSETVECPRWGLLVSNMSEETIAAARRARLLNKVQDRVERQEKARDTSHGRDKSGHAVARRALAVWLRDESSRLAAVHRTKRTSRDTYTAARASLQEQYNSARFWLEVLFAVPCDDQQSLTGKARCGYLTESAPPQKFVTEI